MRKLVVLLAVVAALGIVTSGAFAAGSSKLHDNTFTPTTVNIKKGGAVTWTWAGKNPHNVTSKGNPENFNSKTQTKGTYSHTFKKTGTYNIVCTIHPGMKQTV